MTWPQSQIANNIIVALKWRDKTYIGVDPFHKIISYKREDNPNCWLDQLINGRGLFCS